MTDGNNNGSRKWMAGVLIPISVAAAGFLAQVLWFSAEFGQSTAKLEQLDHRVSNIETLGSPALAGVKPEVGEALRRVQAVEEILPGIRQTQVQIDVNTRRLDAIERIVPDQIQHLFVADAQQTNRIADNTAEIERLRNWRIDQSQINTENAKAIAVLQHHAIK